MIKTALEYLIGLGKAEKFDINGFDYTTKSLYPVKQPTPAAIELSTLTGLVDYIKSAIDTNSAALLLHIESPTEVSLYSGLNVDMSRDRYISCEAITPRITFDQFVDAEKFNIILQSGFVPSPTTADILKVVGNIREETVKQTGDDGISQQVTAKVGIARVEDIKVPNPVTLAPFRTFAEVKQPESKFIFRMKDGPQCALFEADGGKWRLEAIANIKEFFIKELEGLDVKILA